jgi:hypothetical protein
MLDEPATRMSVRMYDNMYACWNENGDPVHHGADEASINEACDLAQLTSVRLHEEEREADPAAHCLSSDA